MTAQTSPARTPQDLNESITGGIGDSPLGPDGTLKVRGEFAYSSDLWAEDMLWGGTLRSPHPCARSNSIDITEAVKHPGVYAVLTHKDVPGENVYGLKVADTPALAAEAKADVVVSDVHTMGMQDKAFLGPESGSAMPAEDGGADLFIATQCLHVDQKVRFTMSGVGGAFGGREDLSMQIHARMLALQPVVHRLPDPDHSGHAADEGGCDRKG